MYNKLYPYGLITFLILCFMSKTVYFKGISIIIILIFNFNLLQILDDPYNICISQRNFAISIAIAGLILMLLTVITALILLMRRHKKSVSSSGSSVYSGPYTNTAFSHTS